LDYIDKDNINNDIELLKQFTLTFNEGFIDSKIRKIFRIDFKPKTYSILDTILNI